MVEFFLVNGRKTLQLRKVKFDLTGFTEAMPAVEIGDR